MTVAYVVIELDTTPPQVGIVGVGRVTPPADIVFTLTSSEDIGWTDLSFTDALGERHEVAAERISPRVMLVSIPTIGLALGEGAFRAAVADTVSNATVVTQTVIVGSVRPSTRAFDVEVEFQRAYSIDQSLYRGFDLEVSFDHEAPLIHEGEVFRLAADVAPATDAATRVLVYPRSAADAAGLTEVATRQLVLPRVAADAASLTEVATGLVIPGEPDADWLALITLDGALAAWPMEEHAPFELGSTTMSTYHDVIGDLDAYLTDGAHTGHLASSPIGPATGYSPYFSGVGNLSNLVPCADTAHAEFLAFGLDDFSIESWSQLDLPVDPASVWHATSVLFNLDTFQAVGGGWLGAVAPEGQPGTEYGVIFEDSTGGRLIGPPNEDELVHHLVYGRRDGDYFIHVDGVEVATLTPPFPVNFNTGSERMNLAGLNGNSLLPGYTHYTFRGKVCWVAFYPFAMTEAMALEHYEIGISLNSPATDLLTQQASSFEADAPLEWIVDVGFETWTAERTNEQAFSGTHSVHLLHPNPPGPEEFGFFVYFALSPAIALPEVPIFDFSGRIRGDSTHPAQATLYLFFYDENMTLVDGRIAADIDIVNDEWREMEFSAPTTVDPSWKFCSLYLAIIGDVALVPFDAGDGYFVDDFHIHVGEG